MTEAKKTRWQNPNFCRCYIESVRISTDDVHYGCLSPGEKKLRLFSDEQWIVGKSVIEIGCGAAQNSIALAKWGAQKCVGIDTSEHMLRYAKKLAERERVTIETRQGDAKKVIRNLKGMFFDLAISSYAMGFICNDTAAITELLKDINRILVDNGVLVFCSTHPSQFNDSKCDEYEWNETPFTFHETVNALREAGFNIRRIVEQTTKNPSRMNKKRRARYPYEPLNILSRFDKLAYLPHTIIYVAQKGLS